MAFTHPWKDNPEATKHFEVGMTMIAINGSDWPEAVCAEVHSVNRQTGMLQIKLIERKPITLDGANLE